MAAAQLWELAAARAAATPDAVLVIDERRREMTFGEFRDAVAGAAAGLAARGVGEGTVVSWQLPSWIETMVLTAALSRLGAVQNPLIMMLREPEVDFICRQVGAQLLIVPEEFRGYGHGAMARSVASGIDGLEVLVSDGRWPAGEPQSLPPRQAAVLASGAPGDEVRWVCYTSGTTSEPKGARHTDRGLMASAATYCAALEPGPEDRIAALAPIAHVGGVLHLVVALMSGAAIVITDVFEPRATARLFSDAKVTYGGNGTPFAVAFLREQRTQQKPLFPELKAFLIGGAPRPVALHHEVRDTLGGIGLVSGYGLTECPFLAWGSPRLSEHGIAATEGRPGSGTQLRVVREDGRVAEPGGRGELRVKSDQLMVGYVDSSLDAAAFDADGFFRTGDLAFLDAEGCVNIVGRLKDVIIRNMENISAREVEDHLLTFPGLRDSTAIGLPDARTGERVCAVLVLEEDAAPPTLAALCAHLEARGLNRRKLPEQIAIVGELPRNAMGKVVKATLVSRLGD